MQKCVLYIIQSNYDKILGNQIQHLVVDNLVRYHHHNIFLYLMQSDNYGGVIQISYPL